MFVFKHHLGIEVVVEDNPYAVVGIEVVVGQGKSFESSRVEEQAWEEQAWEVDPSFPHSSCG